jgi:hypothetical protein
MSVTGEGWFRVADLSASPVDMSGKAAIGLDLPTLIVRSSSPDIFEKLYMYRNPNEVLRL